MKADIEKDVLKIVELRAENIMRLSAVRIRPEGNMVEITGKNAAGKTSVITAIALALGGKQFAVDMPLRKGETWGEIFVDLGRLRVTKTYQQIQDEIDIKLRIEFRDGSRPRSPQAVLDELRGHLMDPIAFLRAKPADRIDIVKQLVPEFDFANNARDRQLVFTARTDVNRDHKRALAARDAITLPIGEKPMRVVIADASAQLLEISRANETTMLRRRRRDEAETDADNKRNQASKLRAQARSLDAEADAIDAKLADAPPLPEIIDAAPLLAQIGEAEKINGTVALFESWERHDDEAKRLDKQSKQLTAEIDKHDKAKTDAIDGIKLPFKGLTIGEDDVLLDGVPFDQAAFSFRLRASLGLAMALDPELRVLLIREFGSLLDADGMKLVAQVAAENGYQVFIETVGDGGLGKILIEDGMVKSHG
jgi:hypothetical protein